MIRSGPVTLRVVRAEDLDTIYDVFADLDTWEFRTGTPPGAMTRESFEDWYAKSLLEDRTTVEFAVTVEDRVVGRCALFGFDSLARHAELGISLLPAETGRGYGTHANRALIEFGFERRNLHRIHLMAVAENARALASYRRLGFVEEGRLREHAWVHGAYTDMVVMGLLRSQWRADRPADRTP